jgi:hypothetical protein
MRLFDHMFCNHARVSWFLMRVVEITLHYQHRPFRPPLYF